jgi:AcrR family transcriptional regulator
MPLPRFEKMPSEMKAQILEAGAREIAAHGYEKASLNRILEASGMSKGAAYYYFEDKADLMATVIRRYWLDFVEDPVSRLQVETPEAFWEWLSHLYEHPYDLMDSQPWMLGFSKVVWDLPPTVRLSGPLGAVWSEAMEWLKQFLVKGRDIGAIRGDLSDDLLMQIVITFDNLHDRWLAEHWDEMDRVEFERFTRIFVDIMRRALEVPFEGDPDGTRPR